MLSKSWKKLISRLRIFFAAPRSPRNVKIVVYSMFGSILLIATYMLSIPYLTKTFTYQEGDIAKEDIYVFRDVYYEKENEFKEQQKEAYKRQRFIFDRDYQVFRDTIEQLDTELSLLSSIQLQGGGAALAKRRLPFLSRARSITRGDIRKALSDRYLFQISEWGVKYATLIFDRYGILDKHPFELKDLRKVGAEIRTINHGVDDEENLIWNSDRLIYSKDIFKYKNHIRLKMLGEDVSLAKYKLREESKKIAIHRTLQYIYRRPYVQYNPPLTEKLKLRAQNAVKPQRYLLKKGLMIAREGDPIDRATFQKIKILNDTYGKTNLNHILGIFLIQISIGFAMAFYVSRFSDLKLREISSSVILISLMIMFMVYSFSISRMLFFQNSNWHLALFIPSGFLGIVGAILLGNRLTFAINIYLSIFIYFISGYQMESFIMSFVTGIAGIHTAAYMERRTQILQGALTITVTLGVLILSSHLTNQWKDAELADKLFVAFVNGIVCVSLASSFLPFYESIFNLPTKFRLLELADNNNPLLKKIAMEAPSTNTHTLMVATLSERAVNAIGGDGLLTRVGCLYHDIGKTLKPTFYAENRHLDEKSDRFKKLGPYKSARIIIGHVVDGIKLARENQLPDKIIAFIPEHHGTTTIQYFYHEALSQASHSKRKYVSREDFQYPGPKPQSRETAVVMIADSVEAAARSIKNPSQKNLEEMIERIIQNKMAEDQFDECGLILSDLKIIKKVFLDVLLNSFHLRPKYPTMKDTKSLEKLQIAKTPNKVKVKV